MTWDETVKRLEGARLNYVAAVWRGAGFDPEIAEELDDIAAALRLLLAHAVPRADRERIKAEFGELENQIASLRHIANGNKGMGANITIEHAGRIPGQLRRLRRLLKLDEEGPDA